MNKELFFEYFVDNVLPKLDTYEVCLYLFLIRNTLFLGNETGVFPINSIAKECRAGRGNMGGSMSPSNVRNILQMLNTAGLVKIEDTQNTGTIISVKWPWEVSGFAQEICSIESLTLDEIDFYDIIENRKFIFLRDKWVCVYCSKKLNENNSVIEHIISRPEGTNHYYNLVASCRTCNNRKGSDSFETHLRNLYRESVISDVEFRVKNEYINAVLNMKIKPDIGDISGTIQKTTK